MYYSLMPLEYAQPSEGLERELREVARDAEALVAAMHGLNEELPNSFPDQQLIRIAISLSQLPNGTAEGCRPPLEYARSRLPAIRREHLLSEETDICGTAASPLMRGALVDERLRHLIASVTTALDEYRRLAAEEPAEELTPDAEVVPPRDIVEGAIAQSLRLEPKLADAAETIKVVAQPNSNLADSFARQIRDGQGLNGLARAELQMPRVIVSWFRKLTHALNSYPSLIRNTANGLKAGADIVEIGLDRWHHFEANMTRFLLDEFRSTCDAFITAASRLDERRARASNRTTIPPENFDLDEARATILSGNLPPEAWLPFITELDLHNTRFMKVSLLSELPNLQKLNLSGTLVGVLTPLAGLTKLADLEVAGSAVHDLKPASGMSNLEHLNFAGSPVDDLTPLSQLKKLKILNIRGSSVMNISPLATVENLEHLNMMNTMIDDVSPLGSLTNLQSLYLRNSGVTDVSSLKHLKNLTITPASLRRQRRR